jgi:hypothetical protein
MLDFPGPGGLTVGQVFTSAGKSWQWDGAKWAAAAGGGAPLDSPSFTGDPKAPTPATADNDTSIATTAFVKAQGYLLNNQVITLSGDLTGSGATAITATLATVNSNVGTFQGLTLDAKGRVTAAANQNYVTGGPYLPTAGGTITGTLTVNANLGVGAYILGQLLTSPTGAATESVALGFNTNNPRIVCWGSSSAGAGQVTFYTTAGGNSLDASGNLTILGGTATKPGGGSWVAPSDPALKSDIASYDSGLAEVLQLEPIQYSYSGKAGLPTDGVFYGLDAEATRPVMPELVGEGVWAPTDPDTEQAAAEPVSFSTIDSGPLIFALVNAVKELSAQLAELKAKVA